LTRVQTVMRRTDLTARVQAEFNDMPGMRLTLAQACRLWGVDRVIAKRVLDRLVDERFLCLLGDVYLRRESDQPCA
jgi:DNA-binding GntR family transcriptional regulator